MERNINRIMSSIFSLSCLLAACGVTPQKIQAAIGMSPQYENETPVVQEYLEGNCPVSGMFFTSASVVEEYEYDAAYCLLYDDADANMFNVEICVDLETYQMVCQAIKEGKELVGALVLNEDYSFDGLEVFTFMPEPEFEMANASAKL